MFHKFSLEASVKSKPTNQKTAHRLLENKTSLLGRRQLLLRIRYFGNPSRTFSELVPSQDGGALVGLVWLECWVMLAHPTCVPLLYWLNPAFVWSGVCPLKEWHSLASFVVGGGSRDTVLNNEQWVEDRQKLLGCSTSLFWLPLLFLDVAFPFFQIEMYFVGFTARSHLETMKQGLRESQNSQPRCIWAAELMPVDLLLDPTWHEKKNNNPNLFKWLVVKFSAFLIYAFHQYEYNYTSFISLIETLQPPCVHICRKSSLFLFRSPLCHSPHSSQLTKGIHPASKTQAERTGNLIATFKVYCSPCDVAVVEKCPWAV